MRYDLGAQLDKRLVEEMSQTLSDDVRQGGERVLVNGVPLWIRVAGVGPPVFVQCPGWGTSCRYLEETLKPLEKFCTVFYCDSRGSGRSGAPEDSTHLSVGHIMKDVETLCDLLGLDRFVLLGHSHGAFTAMNFALRFPERIAGLILIAPQLGVREVAVDLRRSLPKLREEPQYALAASRWDAVRVVRTDRALGSWLESVFDLYFWNPRVGREFWPSLHFDSIGAAAWINVSVSNRCYEVRENLSAITAPTLILVGQHDFITSPDQARVIHQAIPDSKLKILSRSGHFPWLEEPADVFEEIEVFVNEIQESIKGGVDGSTRRSGW